MREQAMERVSIFFVDQGEPVTWEIHETVDKTFFIHVDEDAL